MHRQHTGTAATQRQDTGTTATQRQENGTAAPQRQDTDAAAPQRQDTDRAATQRQHTSTAADEKEDNSKAVTQRPEINTAATQPQNTGTGATQREDTKRAATQRQDIFTVAAQRTDSDPAATQRKDSSAAATQGQDRERAATRGHDTDVAARKQRANNNVAAATRKQDTTAAARKQREDDNMAAASHKQDLTTSATSQREDTRTATMTQRPYTKTAATTQRPYTNAVTVAQREDIRTATTKQRPDTRTAITTQRRDSKTVTMTRREDSKTATTAQRPDTQTATTTQREDIRTVVTTQRHGNISATTQTQDTRTAATTQISDNKAPATTQISDTKTPATTTKRPDITPAATTQKQDNEPAAALYRKDANKASTTQRDNNNNNNNNTATHQQPKDNNDNTALRTSQEEEDVVARRPRTARRRTKHTTLKEPSNRTTQRPIKDAVKTKRRNGKDQRTGQQQLQQQQQQQRQRQQHQQQQYQQHQQQHQKQKQKQQKHQHRSSGTQPNLCTLRAQMKKDIEETYPGFQKRCYFVPPNHFNVSKREKHPHVGDCYALVPTPESNSRADESHERVLEVLTEILRSRTAFVLSGLTFEDYLNKQIPLSPGQPQNLTMPMPLPRSADLNSQYRRGEVEMLVVDKTQGILILDIKAVGDTFDDLKVDEFKAVELVRKVLEKALALMRKSKDVVLHLVSDIPATIPVTVLLVLPNLSRQMLQKTLDSYEHLRKALESCLMTQGSPTEACLCSDDLPGKHQSATDEDLQRMAEWWNGHYPLGPQVIDDDVYEELMGRFCGPFSTITVWTAQLPRKEIRTPGQAISETGDRFATFLLHPSHLEILDSQEPRAHLVGPPGAGKTMVLAVKGAQWAQEGGHVCVLSTEAAAPAPAPVALVIKEMIQKMLKDSKETIDLSHVETDAILEDSNDVEADICIRVKRLETRAKGKPICLIVDGVQEEVLAYIDQLCQQIPDSKVWTSGARPSTCPSGFVLKELSTSVRRSPAVQSLLKMTELPTDSCYKYVTRSTEMVEFPLATQGLPVKLLCHAGHGDGPILQCRECGESLAQYLQELRLGKDLEEKDVMILLADSTPLHSGLMPCQFVQALLDHNVPLDIVDDYTNSQERLAFPSAQITLTNYQYVSGLERKVVIFVPEGTVSDNSVTKTCIEDNDSSEIRGAAGITMNERCNILQSKLKDFVPAERVPSSMRLNRLKDRGENSQEEERHDNVQNNTQEEHQDNKQEVSQNIAHAQENVEKNRQEDRDKSRHKITPEIREDADTKSVQDVRSEKTQHSTENRQDIHQNHTYEDQQRNFEEAAIITATKCHEVGDQHFLEEHTGQQVKDHRGNIREEHRHDDVQKNTQEGNQDSRQSTPGSTNCNDRNKTVTHTSAKTTSTLTVDVTCADSLILKDLSRLESQAGHHSEYERDTEGEREDESDSEYSIIDSIANSSSGYDSDEDDASELEPESSTETLYPLENTCTPFPPQSEGMDTPEVCAMAKILDHEEKHNNSLTKDCGDSCLESELSSSEAVELSVHSLEDVHVHVSDIEEETDTSSRQACDVEDEDEAPQPASCPGDADSSAIPPGDPSIFEKYCSVESLLEQKATLREGRDLGQGVMRSAESRLQGAVQSLSLANREKLWCSVSRSLAHAVVFHF